MLFLWLLSNSLGVEVVLLRNEKMSCFCIGMWSQMPSFFFFFWSLVLCATFPRVTVIFGAILPQLMYLVIENWNMGSFIFILAKRTKWVFVFVFLICLRIFLTLVCVLLWFSCQKRQVQWNCIRGYLRAGYLLLFLFSFSHPAQVCLNSWFQMSWCVLFFLYWYQSSSFF